MEIQTPPPLAIMTLTPANKRFLLQDAGFISIYEAKKYLKDNGIKYTAKEIYQELQEEYNDKIGKKEQAENEAVEELNVEKTVDAGSIQANIIRVKDTLEQYKGKSINYIFADQDGNIIRNSSYDIPVQFSSWYNKTFYNILMVSSEETLFDIYPDGIILTYESVDLPIEKIVQQFREGITHCVLDQVKQWATNALKESTSLTAIKRYKKALADTEHSIKKFDKGITAENMQEFCNLVQVDYTIYLPFSDTPFIICKSDRKALKHFKATNTKINHVEQLTICETPIKLNRSNLLLKFAELHPIKTGEHMTYKKDNINVKAIYTATQNYILESEFNETVNEFEQTTGICDCAIDTIAKPELSEFIRPHYNATIDLQDHMSIDEEIYHLDMVKGYSQHKQNKYYCGFLGKITDFRQTDKMEGVGIYQIENIIFPETNIGKLLKKMFYNGCRYSTPEINYLKDKGVSFKYVAGAWGVDPLDFEFNDAMLNKREILSGKETDKLEGNADSVRYFAKWAGAIDSQNKYTYEYMFGSYDYYQVLRSETDNVKFYKNGEIQYRKEKTHNFSKSHITHFITAYMRLNVLEQLEQIEFRNLVRVCVDGIYHTQKEVKICNAFRPKDERKFGNIAGNSYTSYLEGYNYLQLPAYRKNYKKTLATGAGGNGKTHKNLTDEGLVNVLFVAPSWKLALNKKKEYGCDANVWANILSNDPQKISLIRRNYNSLIIDEISMLTETEKEFIFKTYYDMKLIFCGDIDYQIGSITRNDMTNKGFDIIMENETNYRCKDLELIKKLNLIRSMIKHSVSNFEIKQYILTEFTSVSIEEVIEKYSVEDMILTGVNYTKNFITEKLLDKPEKYYITANSREFSKGEIVIGSKPETKCEIRHCFTTHSIQGETAENNLFIDSSSMFCPRVWYTSLSRARTMDQIYIIKECSKMKQVRTEGRACIMEKQKEEEVMKEVRKVKKCMK